MTMLTFKGLHRCIHILWMIEFKYKRLKASTDTPVRFITFKIEYLAVGDTWWQPLLSYGNCIWPI